MARTPRQKLLHAANQRRYHQKHPELTRARKAKWVAENPDREKAIRRRGVLKHRYGLSPEAYEALLSGQGGYCAICGGEQLAGRNFAVDHDHKTNEIRGLLCSNCNMGLGAFQDSPDLLLAAAAYLERARG
jgi:hypothetical protein